VAVTAKHRHPVSQEAFDAMCASASAALPKETGGVLLGFRTDRGVHITGALEVPDGRATRFSYRRSHRKAAKQLAAFLALEPADCPVGYVGEWHSHTAPLPPSPVDIVALGSTALESGDDIVLVVMRRIDDEWSATVAEARRAKSGDGSRSRPARRSSSVEADELDAVNR
jgi:proteasome lid subunit RPN8/RPN11